MSGDAELSKRTRNVVTVLFKCDMEDLRTCPGFELEKIQF